MVTTLLLAEEDFASYIIFACCCLFWNLDWKFGEAKKKSLNKDASVFLTILLYFFHSHPYGPFP